MTLARKGSRRISVDGVTYRWTVRGRATYTRGLAWRPLAYAVEHGGTSGATLVVTTNQPHPSNWFVLPARAVFPAAVAVAIRTARASGWAPEKPGQPFHLDQSEGFTPAS
ncbi:hypothetical protein AB0D56_32555 [Streptomyces sp. NPDC048209]|uniref:hypothetical protein n=1 Tax=Streptomyces sp. NPDC048209 TaxID=3156689 RepID=UPI00341469F2